MRQAAALLAELGLGTAAQYNFSPNEPGSTQNLLKSLLFGVS